MGGMLAARAARRQCACTNVLAPTADPFDANLAQPAVKVGHTRTGHLGERRSKPLSVEPVAISHCGTARPAGIDILRVPPGATVVKWSSVRSGGHAFSVDSAAGITLRPGAGVEIQPSAIKRNKTKAPRSTQIST
jgi:hypothetical protein